jgi:hypothetical protein
MNQRRLKSWKFYAFLFLLAFLALGGVALYKYFAGTYTTADLWNAIVLPLVLSIVMFLSDYVMQKLSDKRKRTNYEGNFLEAVAERMRASKLFLIEDFRRLKESVRFQEALKYAFYITQNGESEHFTVARLEKKFDARSLEGKAIEYVITYVREILAEKPMGNRVEKHSKKQK